MAWSIGQVAKHLGIGIETIRFYEREGLIPEPPRRPSGYRQYDESIVGRLQFIRHAKHLGFTLKEIRELLDLRRSDDGPCDVRGMTRDKLAEIDRRIDELRQMRASLEQLLAHCDGRHHSQDCDILKAVETEDFEATS